MSLTPTATATCPGATITSAAQASELANCDTIQSDIVVDPSYSDAEFKLDGVRNITGNFIVDANSQLKAIVAADLQAIGATFQVTNLPALATLSMPKLQSARQTNWTALSDDFEAADLPAFTTCFSFAIAQTGLRNVSWLTLDSAWSLTFDGNQHLTDLSLPHFMGGGSYATNTVWINNPASNTVVDFPNYTNGSISCWSGCTSVSLPALATCGSGDGNGFIQFVNSSVESISLPALKTCGGLIVHGNTNLKDMSTSLLESVTVPDRMAPWIVGISIGDNALLDQTITFPALKTLNGASFNGSFSGVSMPSLNNETRLLTFNSTQDISATCEHFRSIAGPSNIVKGELTCTYSSSNSAGSTGTAHSNHHAAVVGGAAGGAVAFIVLFVGLIVGGYFWRMRRNARRPVVSHDHESTSYVDEVVEIPKQG